jgi:hypothetical protein
VIDLSRGWESRVRAFSKRCSSFLRERLVVRHSRLLLHASRGSSGILAAFF